MDILNPPPSPINVDATLEALARRYRRAGGVGVAVLNLVGGRAEALVERLPGPVRDNLDEATERALLLAMRVAHGSRRTVPDQAGWVNTMVAAAMGAAGGFGGLPTALAELPVTTAVILRSIEGVAVEHGFDPDAKSVQFDCIRVLASAGPLVEDDGSDLAFLGTRLTLTGATLQGLIARVAPRLATVLGQKLAAQTVPVLGAVAGAATNFAYTSYYQEMAQVHFRLRKLAIDADRPHAELIEDLRARVVRQISEA